MIGKLDRRITVRRIAATVDAYNEPVGVPADHMTIWAAKKDISDRERLSAAEIGATITTRFTIRWSCKAAEITPKDLVLCDGRTYDIHGIKEIGRRRYLEITAAARAE